MNGRKNPHRRPRGLAKLACLALPLLTLAPAAHAQATQACKTAEVVALDQFFWLNRLGASEPQGMIYALRRDVVPRSFNEDVCPQSQPQMNQLSAGMIKLRRSVRPRPLVLRINEGDCLDISFKNLLDPVRRDEEQPNERDASIHIVGMQYVTAPQDGGMNIATDPNGVVSPGNSITYRVFAEKEGTYLMYSGAAMTGGENYAGSISAGLFGAITVEPRDSRYFRSQTSKKDFDLAKVPAPAGWDTSFPYLNYSAVYPAASLDPEICWQAGEPILEMTQNGKILQPDLNAAITGPGDRLAGWDANPPTSVPNIYWDRNEPFREFTVIFHDEIGAVQAFPHFQDQILQHTLHSVRDAFAVNYGTGGAGAEVLANRLGVGPMHKCVDCRYEEFFLTSWAVGDPAMVVDVPANYPCSESDLKQGKNCVPTPGVKATVAYYPDDPSNVHHSYLNDHVKFRNLLAGSDDHHIFHLHAHQWLQTPNADTSTYMDSQAIGQGTSFTYDIAYGGSGNRNQTPGDSIFHCHYYPHFAQGMWELWRVHDTLETGTELDKQGRPVYKLNKLGEVVTTTRALPDGEIKYGTPIPAIVPLPNKAMAPRPTGVRLVDGRIDTTYVLNQANVAKTALSPYFNPGFPFYIPGESGERPPQPPLDFAPGGSSPSGVRDGGLPRWVALKGTSVSHQSRLDMSKDVVSLRAKWLPHDGTDLEKIAMETHERVGFDTPAANTNAAPAATLKDIRFNGMLRVAGAPFADPCRTDAGAPIPVTRRYKGADIELDIKLNKEGWHFPQSRISTLIEDVPATLAGTRNPEPLFIRANSNQCIEYQFTNLVPMDYQTDDFQVKTPTDIIGQHIHLVKFDVLASDGGGNGFNYQDGSSSPEVVQQIINAVRTWNGCPAGVTDTYDPVTGELKCPTAVADERFGDGNDVNCNEYPDFKGAQTTVQRWWADPVVGNDGRDRTLQTVFTHDHFGPSTHQQAGLYAGLIVEPAGATFVHNETGSPLSSGRADGGPTSWQARIIDREKGTSVREFALEFADFQLAYEQPRGSCYERTCPDREIGLANPALAINPAGHKESDDVNLLYEKLWTCPTNPNDPDGTLATEHLALAAPCPEAVSAHDPGYISVNYRTEPLALRIADPSAGGPPTQAAGLRGDPSFAYETRTDRSLATMNNPPYAPGLRCVNYGPLTSDLRPGDPFTPVMRTYEGDDMKIRILVGAHEEEHNLTVNGIKWLRQEFYEDSGWRDSQMMGISEHFELAVPGIPSLGNDKRQVDLLYRASAAEEWQWNGAWGLIRVSAGVRDDLRPLDDVNPRGQVDPDAKQAAYGQVDAAKLGPQPITQAEKEAGLAPDTFGSSKPGLDPVPPGSTPATITCPKGAPVRVFDITAVAANETLPIANANTGRTLVYNRRGGAAQKGPLHDPTAMLFVPTEDLDYATANGRPVLRPNVPVEPLIIRAAAGECAEVTLRNDLPPMPSDPRNPGWAGFGFDLPGWSGYHMIIEGFNANQVKPSREVGLHPQLVSYDPGQSDGMNIGLNPGMYGKQTVEPGQKITYYWYMGDQTEVGASIVHTPIEFGATGLTSSDTLKHTNKGAVGAMIVEPEDAQLPVTITDNQSYETNTESRFTRAEATIASTNGTWRFREFVTIFQNDINMRYGNRQSDAVYGSDAVPNLLVFGDPTESGQKAFNYRTEPVWFRFGDDPNDQGDHANLDQSLRNSLVGAAPVTPIFTAKPREPVRFRVVHPGGHTQSSVFEVQGHIWQEYPYTSNAMKSDAIGDNPKSQWEGTRYGMGPSDHDDIIPIHGAGGAYGICGKYLYRDYVPWYFGSGLWGLFDVNCGGTTDVPPKSPAQQSPSISSNNGPGLSGASSAPSTFTASSSPTPGDQN